MKLSSGDLQWGTAVPHIFKTEDPGSKLTSNFETPKPLGKLCHMPYIMLRFQSCLPFIFLLVEGEGEREREMGVTKEEVEAALIGKLNPSHLVSVFFSSAPFFL